MSQRRILGLSPGAIALVSAAGLLTAGSVWVNQPAVCACGSPLRDVVGVMGRTQQAFYVEQGRFASRSELERLMADWGMPPTDPQYRITIGHDGQTAWVLGEHPAIAQPDALTWWQVLTDRPFARQLPSNYRMVLTVDPKTKTVQAQTCIIDRRWVGAVPVEPLRLQTQPPQCKS